MSPPRYPSDLSDEEWTILEPLLSSTEKRGRPPKWPLRHVANAVFYLLRRDVRGGCYPASTRRGRRSTTTSASGG